MAEDDTVINCSICGDDCIKSDLVEGEDYCHACLEQMRLSEELGDKEE